MNTVERIRELEPKAEKTSALGSKLHWEVAELYWIAIEKDGITKASLARQVGKTAMHVLYMYRCWDRIVAKPGLVWDGDYGNLPSFYQTYNSDDVRSPDDEDENGHGGGEGSRRSASSRNEQQADYTGHGLVTDIANGVHALSRNPAYIPLLTEDDIHVLREAYAALRALLADIAPGNRRR